MKKWILVLLPIMVLAPLLSQAAGVPGFMVERMGTLSGQVADDTGQPLKGGGVVSFFNTSKGIPPLVADMHRIPDMVGRMGPDGRFSIKLLPGTYYLGALIITDKGRGPGPPREGEKFFFARNDKGNLLELTLALKENKAVGKVVVAAPETFPLVKNLVTIEGRLITDERKPFKDGVVLVKTDMNSARPDFVSERTKADGKFKLQLPPDTPYYLLGRERAVGRPVPGTYIGTYGSTSPISEGGSLPIGNVRPVQPASGMPQVEGVELGPGKDLPSTITGKAGQTIAGIEIIMFKMPVPGEQREKLQGTLGFGDKLKEGGGAGAKKTEAAPTKGK